MKIIFDKEKCAGCNICAIACMDQNDYDPSYMTDPFRTVTADERGEKCSYDSRSCLHCGLCINVCPRHCIRKDPDTGFVVYDNTECIGCGACRKVCPVSAPKIYKEKMNKCDGCNERVKAGLLPSCVRRCPTEALKLV